MQAATFPHISKFDGERKKHAHTSIFHRSINTRNHFWMATFIKINTAYTLTYQYSLQGIYILDIL